MGNVMEKREKRRRVSKARPSPATGQGREEKQGVRILTPPRHPACRLCPLSRPLFCAAAGSAVYSIGKQKEACFLQNKKKQK